MLIDRTVPRVDLIFIDQTLRCPFLTSIFIDQVRPHLHVIPSTFAVARMPLPSSLFCPDLTKAWGCMIVSGAYLLRIKSLTLGI